MTVVEEINTKNALRITNAWLSEAQYEAPYFGCGDMEAIKKALEKQIPKKPSFVDTRFRQRGVRYGECVTLDRCYKCPSCNTHIFHDFDSEIYCKYCGQKLDWEEGEE